VGEPKLKLKEKPFAISKWAVWEAYQRGSSGKSVGKFRGSEHIHGRIFGMRGLPCLGRGVAAGRSLTCPLSLPEGA
jgi:hypothetical protein